MAAQSSVRIHRDYNMVKNDFYCFHFVCFIFNSDDRYNFFLHNETKLYVYRFQILKKE